MMVVEDPEQAALLLDPTRLRILTGLREPGSAAGVARALGLPRQKVNYHLRELERGGLLEDVELRRKGNCIERFVRAKATTFLVSPTTLGPLATEPEHVQDRFSAAYLMALASRAIRELASLRRFAQREGKKLATLSLDTEVRFASASDRKAFAEELTEAVARLTTKYHRGDAPRGRTFRVVVSSYPTLPRSDSEIPQNSDPEASTHAH